MAKWMVLILIISASLIAGFLIGGAHVSKQFDKQYKSIKAELDWLYEGQCGREEHGKGTTETKGPTVKHIRWGKLTG